MPSTSQSQLHAFIINLDRSKDRLLHTQQQLDLAGIAHSRVPGIEGKNITIPHPQYHKLAYILKHGKRTNLSEIGCYLSHLKSYEVFLKSDHKYALICEDDITIPANTKNIIDLIISANTQWDMVKISKINSSLPVTVENLSPQYQLAINLGRHTGAGAYLINRQAATALIRTISVMSIPLDHAFDKEWRCNIRAFSLQPTLISQEETKFKTTITEPRSYKLPSWQRYWTVVPYRIMTEIIRIIYRSFIIQKLRLGKNR